MFYALWLDSENIPPLTKSRVLSDSGDPVRHALCVWSSLGLLHLNRSWRTTFFDRDSSRFGVWNATSLFAAPALAPVETPVLHVFSDTWQTPVA
jgi:hypothetical protein